MARFDPVASAALVVGAAVAAVAAVDGDLGAGYPSGEGRLPVIEA